MKRSLWIVIGLSELLLLIVLMYFWSMRDAAYVTTLTARQLHFVIHFFFPIALAIPCAISAAVVRPRSASVYGMIAGALVAALPYVIQDLPMMLVSPLSGLYWIAVFAVDQLVRPEGVPSYQLVQPIAAFPWYIAHIAYGGILAALFAHKYNRTAILLLIGTMMFNVVLLQGLAA